jgi:hypothetical protein
VTDPVELYQLIGCAIRDVAQARFVADLYSRQLSYQYERDTLLRRFPVPRAEIDEAEISLFFSVVGVSVDPARHTSRNAAIGSLFDQYSIRIVRDILEGLRTSLTPVPTNGGAGATTVADSFRARVLAPTNVDLLSGRVLQYLNENPEDVMVAVEVKGSDGKPPPNRWDTIERDVIQKQVIDQLSSDAQAASFYGLTQQAWDAAQKAVKESHPWLAALGEMADAIADIKDKYPDCRILVNVDPQAIAGSGAVSTIKIKASVKNYKWSKIDIDKGDLRNIRALNPE